MARIAKLELIESLESVVHSTSVKQPQKIRAASHRDVLTIVDRLLQFGILKRPGAAARVSLSLQHHHFEAFAKVS